MVVQEQESLAGVGGGVDAGSSPPSWLTHQPPDNATEVGPPSRDDFDARLTLCLSHLQYLARRLTFTPAQASDLVQETCLRALDNWQTILTCTVDELKRWLRTVMRHFHFDLSQKRRREVPDLLIDDIAAPAVASLQRWRLVDDCSLTAAVAALPDRLRTPYVLFSEGLSYIAIARSLGIPQSTVGTRLRRARSQLEKILEPTVAVARGDRAPVRVGRHV